MKSVRRKSIRSCELCRTRKLRCDRKRPRCSTCIRKKASECSYAIGFEQDVDFRERSEAMKEAKLLEDINVLEKRLESKGGVVCELSKDINLIHEYEPCDAILANKSTVYRMSSQSVTSDVCGDKRKNNLLNDFYTLQCKEDGRRIYYGPTSVKTFMAKSKWGLLGRFRQTWSVVKVARKKWKKLNGRNILEELEFINSSSQIPGSLPCNLLEGVCHALPSYEKIRSHIEFFFDEKILFQISDVVDKEKIFKDLSTEFIPDRLSTTVEKRIAALSPSGKKNYYKIGVILMILGFTYFHESIPTILQNFLTYLTGASMAKYIYVERAQFLMLRFHHFSRYSCTGEDNNHAVILADSLISTVSLLGLNRDISILYSGQEDQVGNLSTLTKLRDWTLSADIKMAFQLGRPLSSYSTELDDYGYTDNVIGKTPKSLESSSFYSVFKTFLRISRSILLEIHNKKAIPNLKEMCYVLTEFIEQNFRPISLYTSPCSIKKEYIREIGIVCQALSMLLSLYNLRYLALSEMSVGLKNAVIKNSLVSLSLYACLTSYCIKQDNKNSSESCQSNSENAQPYFFLSLSLSGELAYRSLITFYGLLYNTLTLFQSGLICAAGTHSLDKCDLETLDVDETANISFSVYFKTFCEIVGRISNIENIKSKQLSRRSYAFVSLLALANSCQNTVKKTLRNKNCQKNPWISPLEQFPSLDLLEENICHNLKNGYNVGPISSPDVIKISNPSLFSESLGYEPSFEDLLREIPSQNDFLNLLFDENHFSASTEGNS